MIVPIGILGLLRELAGFFYDIVSQGINWFRGFNISILWSWLPADISGTLSTVLMVLCFVALIHIIVKIFGMLP